MNYVDLTMPKSINLFQLKKVVSNNKGFEIRHEEL